MSENEVNEVSKAEANEIGFDERALNAEDLLCKLIVYAQPLEAGGYQIPRFLVEEAKALVPDWGRRHSRPLERQAQAEALAKLPKDDSWHPRPLLSREQVEAVGDGETHLVRLSRLWEPEPKVIYEGEALIRRDRDLLTVVAPGVDSWAEYSLNYDFSGDCLVGEDYLLEFLWAPAS